MVLFYKLSMTQNFKAISSQALPLFAAEKALLLSSRWIRHTYIPDLFYRKHGVPAWKKPKYRPGQPLTDTARLANSFDSRVASATSIEIFSKLVYAGIQSTGGVIKAKNKSGLLWIPNGDVFGNSERRLIGPKDIHGLFRPRGKGGKRLPILCLRVGGGNLFGIKKRFRGDKKKNANDQGLIIYFFGTPSVKIPPRPIFSGGGVPNGYFSEGLERILGHFMRRVWAGREWGQPEWE